MNLVSGVAIKASKTSCPASAGVIRKYKGDSSNKTTAVLFSSSFPRQKETILHLVSYVFWLVSSVNCPSSKNRAGF